MATDDDFEKVLSEDGDYLKYTGTEEYVEIPHTINDVPVTSYKRMFKESPVKGVKSTNKNITDMSDMFFVSQASSLDLSSFDTSGVTNMFAMFAESQASNLDLRSFDTSEVTNMYAMFGRSQATSLDLSSFDTSNVTNMSLMFDESHATTGYARTQEDANKFNTSSNKPTGLNFTVKP